MEIDTNKPWREIVECFIYENHQLLKRRLRLQSIGYALFGLAMGQLLGNLIRLCVLHDTFPWWQWVFFAVTAIGFVIVSFGLIYNGRLIKHLRAAILNMIGILRSPNQSSKQKHHFEQAYAACDVLDKIMRARSKKNANQAETKPAS